MARTAKNKKSSASSGAPKSLHIRTYQMGFGDCFLLTFEYSDPKKNRHVLIDFGSIKQPPGASNLIQKVAQSIKAECGGKLHIVVATHRHRDHVSGFGDKTAGPIIENLKPDVVIQPWTEDPDIPIDAEKHGSPARRARLHAMNKFADAAFSNMSVSSLRHLDSVDNSLFEKLAFIGEDNITNKEAVKRLMRMGKAGRAVYARALQGLNLERVLPGVTVDVLGPPTIEQEPSVKSASHKNEDEFWHMHAAAAAAAMEGVTSNDPFPRHQTAKTGWDTKWTLYRMKLLRLDMMLQIVRILDNALNNTSLILLFRVGDRSILFPGDAQLENWSLALADKKVMALLKDIDIYKVGHHGSLNATPKSLWNKFAKKGPASKTGRLISLLSTLEGKYGDDDKRTEVPRSTLVKALKANTQLVSTNTFDAGQLFESTRLNLQ